MLRCEVALKREIRWPPAYVESCPDARVVQVRQTGIIPVLRNALTAFTADCVGAWALPSAGEVIAWGSAVAWADHWIHLEMHSTLFIAKPSVSVFKHESCYFFCCFFHFPIGSVMLAKPEFGDCDIYPVHGLCVVQDHTKELLFVSSTLQI